MREAPAVPIIKALLEAGASVRAYDPEAMKVARDIFGTRIPSPTRATTRSPAPTRLAHRHRVERVPRAGLRARCKKLMQTPVIFDGRNLYNPDQLRGLGFTYLSIGRR